MVVPMSTNDPKGASSDGLTRKQRRAAERTSRTSRTSRKGTRSAPGSGSSPSSGPSMFIISLAAVLIGLVAVAALVIISGGFGDDTEAAAVSRPEIPPPAQELRQGRTLVQAGVTPPVTIDAYEDPQCPACGLFTERIEPLIIAEHVETGTASFTYNDFVFLGDESWNAAIAMRVAEDMDGKFWDYHQALFHNQSGENAGGFTPERLADIAELVDLDRAEFLERLDDPAYREAVEADNERARELTVNSTPTLVVNGEVVRGVPQWEDLDAIIRAAAAAATAS
jgi:protein-disulfide isomerase